MIAGSCSIIERMRIAPVIARGQSRDGKMARRRERLHQLASARVRVVPTDKGVKGGTVGGDRRPVIPMPIRNGADRTGWQVRATASRQASAAREIWSGSKKTHSGSTSA